LGNSSEVYCGEGIVRGKAPTVLRTCILGISTCEWMDAKFCYFWFFCLFRRVHIRIS